MLVRGRFVASFYNELLLPAAQSERVRVVLVSPRNPLNIGAVARAMANFGLTHLTIVAPFAVNWTEAKSAVGAPDLLRRACVTETLAEAVADCALVIGTGSLDRRRPEQRIFSMPEAAAALRAVLGDEPGDEHYDEPGKTSPRKALPRVALVFGSEKHGLTSDDLTWCHAIAVIETAAEQPSMNLGQAVAVALYELTRAADPLPALPLGALPPVPAALPSSEQLDRLAALIEETMEQANYLTRGLRSANGAALRILLRRLLPNDADLRRIMGLFRRILWRLRHPPQ